MKLIVPVSMTILVAFAAPAHPEPIYQITKPPANTSDGWPTFSPRGDKVAFARFPDGAPAVTAILVADATGGAEDTLVSGLPAGFNPNGGMEWSPDGRKIAFYANSQGAGHSAVWVADVPGSGIPRIVGATRHPNFCCWSAIASDGTILQFTV